MVGGDDCLEEVIAGASGLIGEDRDKLLDFDGRERHDRCVRFGLGVSGLGPHSLSVDTSRDGWVSGPPRTLRTLDTP